jgi:hypothetical protein
MTDDHPTITITTRPARGQAAVCATQRAEPYQFISNTIIRLRLLRTGGNRRSRVYGLRYPACPDRAAGRNCNLASRLTVITIHQRPKLSPSFKRNGITHFITQIITQIVTQKISAIAVPRRSCSCQQRPEQMGAVSRHTSMIVRQAGRGLGLREVEGHTATILVML